MKRRVVVLPDADAVAQTAAARFLTAIADALTVQDRAHVVVTGGTVGIATLAAIAESPLRDSIDWTSVHVWWGDERFVAAGDPDRNEGQAQGALLSHVPLPEDNIHRMGNSDEFSSAEAAAAAYHGEIADHGNPQWDVLMLGLGPDGHVASLFPQHAGFTQAAASVIAVHDSPKPPPTRVSLGLSAITRARQVWVVAAGEGKAEAVRDCLAGNTSYPGAVVHGTEGTLWLVDAAAAAKA
ncbi:6-phosphogluconolactonase [Demequina aurantiaca]|uniref:6-phosphogluconolactonase n=1 Tax=Demequina aurantiaca TaxID=676200 RepID=UPI0007845C9B|nr:6-phosphogluconolactonase [Demequina aurantiaca]